MELKIFTLQFEDHLSEADWVPGTTVKILPTKGRDFLLPGARYDVGRAFGAALLSYLGDPELLERRCLALGDYTLSAYRITLVRGDRERFDRLAQVVAPLGVVIDPVGPPSGSPYSAVTLEPVPFEWGMRVLLSSEPKCSRIVAFGPDYMYYRYWQRDGDWWGRLDGGPTNP